VPRKRRTAIFLVLEHGIEDEGGDEKENKKEYFAWNKNYSV